MEAPSQWAGTAPLYAAPQGPSTHHWFMLS